jgi:ribonucleoside-diphosphate reductase alpha chain
MRVKKRSGRVEPVDLDKVVKAIARCCHGLEHVDALRVATRTISGLYDGVSTREIDSLAIQTAAALTAEEPEYAQLAARLLAASIDKEVTAHEIHAFSASINVAFNAGLINERVRSFVSNNSRKLNAAIDPRRTELFEYFGLRTLYDRYLLRHPTLRTVIETPQYFFLRVACGLADNLVDVLELYDLFSRLEYLPSSPTLFNAATRHEQLSSCFLLDSPQDELEAIYRRYLDVALLSKFSGGIGLAYHRIRSRGSLIKGTNGFSNGIIPWLKTLDASVAAVNQCFAPETRLFTADGVKAIRDVQVGELVLGISGTYRAVTEKMTYNQRDPMVCVTIEHAIEPVRVTSGHPFYAICGIPIEQSIHRTMAQLERGEYMASWVEAGTLSRGDYVAQVIPREVVPVDGLTEDDARLYGILLGDRNTTADGYEWIVRGNPQRDQHLQFVRDYLTARGIHFWETSQGESHGQIRWETGLGAKRDASTGRTVSVRAPIMPLTYQDLYDDQGRKRIARRFAHLPRSQSLALLQGIIETSGAVSHGNEICLTSTSAALVEGVRYQLLRMGVPCAGQCRVDANTNTATFSGTTQIYELRIPAVPALAERVGCKPLTQPNWILWQGCVFSRVLTVESMSMTPFVMDLKVEGDESYMTTAGLVHNGGKRKGACCVYLESWHADIEDFLELRENTGDQARRTHNLNLANWVPDLFMRRVERDEMWSLFDPKDVPTLCDLYGPAFDEAYEQAERDGLAKKQVKARDLYGRMMRALAQTGNGWMTFKDKSNRACNQTALEGRIVHLSNLCTEIIEVTSEDETAVCNLGSINLARHCTESGFDFDRLGRTVRTAVAQLDRVIDRNFYPIESAKRSNLRWRPVGLGVMGLQDVFFILRYAFDSPEARALSAKIAEEIYFHALDASCTLAESLGAHPSFHETRAARGELQFDAWNVVPKDIARWNALRERIQRVGLRNSLLIAIAPTATIASIAGCYECIEPQVSNLFKRETLSGDFLQVNRYLVAELRRLNRWNEETRNTLKLSEGSVQALPWLSHELKLRFRTAWEIPMRSLIDMAADRGAFIDQSQSLNLFVESPTIGKLSSMYMYAWKRGLKTTYYLRSRPATKIAKATATSDGTTLCTAPTVTDTEAAVACSLENPGSCEACQ